MAQPGDLDEEALAEAYNRALSLEKAGRLDEAAAAYREVLEIDPADCGGAAVRLASIGRGPTPERAPPAYVETLFDQHAEVFDNVLVEQLGYAVPVQLRQTLDELGLGPFDRVLDLGCGTGLTGGELRDRAAYLAGVDIAEKMVELAFEREVYDDLYVDEALDFVADGEADERWDLIAATDVMPYLGDLEPIISEISTRLADGGIFAFSTETLPETQMDGQDFIVGPYQRFAHREAYLRDLLARQKLDTVVFEPITVRHEQGAPIAGHLVLAIRADSG